LKQPATDVPARDHAEQSCVIKCPACGHLHEQSLQGEHRAVRCNQCAADIPLDLASHVGAEGTLDGCPCCEYHTLFIQKDVNNKLGVILVAIVFLGLLVARVALPWLVGILLAFTLLDVVLLRLLVKRLLICYRCKAQFRGFPPGEHCRPFDLATWEAHGEA
jgi:hypothetical protein